jgi:hypothetical protein
MGREKMKVVNQSQKVNPQSSNNKVGMENFLNPPKEQSKKEEIKAESKQMPKVESSKNIINDVEEKIKELEKILANTKELDLTSFNNLAYSKHLTFKLLFITSKIYLYVKNPEGKSAIVAVTPPRWGGTSLRYMMLQCVTEYCRVVEKVTNKGKILSYEPLTLASNETTDDDIFD